MQGSTQETHSPQFQAFTAKRRRQTSSPFSRLRTVVGSTKLQSHTHPQIFATNPVHFYCSTHNHLHSWINSWTTRVQKLLGCLPISHPTFGWKDIIVSHKDHLKEVKFCGVPQRLKNNKMPPVLVKWVKRHQLKLILEPKIIHLNRASLGRL